MEEKSLQVIGDNYEVVLSGQIIKSLPEIKKINTRVIGGSFPFPQVEKAFQRYLEGTRCDIVILFSQEINLDVKLEVLINHGTHETIFAVEFTDRKWRLVSKN